MTKTLLLRQRFLRKGIVPTLPPFAPRARRLVPKALRLGKHSRTFTTSGARAQGTMVSMNPNSVTDGVLTLDTWKVPRAPSPVEITAALLRGRFTALVIWHLFWGGKRFYQLVRELEGVPRKALAHELEELAHELADRTQAVIDAPPWAE